MQRGTVRGEYVQVCSERLEGITRAGKGLSSDASDADGLDGWGRPVLVYLSITQRLERLLILVPAPTWFHFYRE